MSKPNLKNHRNNTFDETKENLTAINESDNNVTSVADEVVKEITIPVLPSLLDNLTSKIRELEDKLTEKEILKTEIKFPTFEETQEIFLHNQKVFKKINLFDMYREKILAFLKDTVEEEVNFEADKFQVIFEYHRQSWLSVKNPEIIKVMCNHLVDMLDNGIENQKSNIKQF